RDEVDDGAEPACGNRRLINAFALLVQATEELVDYPVGRSLAVAALGHRLKVIGGSALGDEHSSFIGREPIVLDEASSLVVGKLRQGWLDARDQICIERERQEICIALGA